MVYLNFHSFEEMAVKVMVLLLVSVSIIDTIIYWSMHIMNEGVYTNYIDYNYLNLSDYASDSDVLFDIDHSCIWMIFD